MSQTTITDDLFQSSISFISPGMSSTISDDGTIDENLVLMRLNQLRMWQQNQQQALIDQQLSQRELLHQEKQKLYEMFGLSLNSEKDIDNDEDDDDTSDAITVKENLKLQNDEFPSTESKILFNKNEEILLKSPPIKLNMDKIVQNMSVRTVASEENKNLPKHTFLKRGEGLKKRFKISPDALRLNNLPKYKFAKSTHALSASNINRRHTEEKQNPYDDGKTSAIPSTVTTKLPGEGHQNKPNENVIIKKPNQNNNNNNQLKKSKQRLSGELKLKSHKRKNVNGAEHNLRDVNAVTLVHSSNGKLNAIFFTFISWLTFRLFFFVRCFFSFFLFIFQFFVFLARANQQQNVKDNLTPSTPSTKHLFDTPIRNRVQQQQHELALFEKLENHLKQSSQCESNKKMASSANNPDDLLVQFELGLKLIQDDKDKSILNDTTTTTASSSDESRHVHFASDTNAYHHHHHHQMYNDDDDDVDDDNNYDDQQPSTSTSTNHINRIPIIQNTSSPFEKSTDSFRKFKEKLFDRKLKQKFETHLSLAKNFELTDWNSDDNGSIISGIDDTLVSISNTATPTPNELKEKSALMEQRLKELEIEINSFREQNSELMKLIREYEQIRMIFDEERNQCQQKIEDDRIQFEKYMHDEKIKLTSERIELDRKLKELQRPTRTDRDEIIKLREQCTNHEKDLNARDQKHIAAQARLRAQLRTVEKDFKELQFEIENLRRENKKLDTENVRLRRQGSNKLLHEINKNIAKLTPLNGVPPDDALIVESGRQRSKSQGGVKQCSNKSAHKTVVAKVTTHREGIRNHIRSKSVPNLTETEKISCSAVTSPTVSDCENGFSDDDTKDKTLGYFGVNAIDKPTTAPEKLKQQNSSSGQSETNSTQSFKRIIENPDGSKDVWYPNGNLKKISADAMLVRMLYFNKDIKETDVREGTIKYYYAETNTWHTTYADGLEIIEFPK